MPLTGCWSTALRRWVEQLDHECGGITPPSKVLTPEQQRIQESEALIKRLERERSILKKATVFLVADEIKPTY